MRRKNYVYVGTVSLLLVKVHATCTCTYSPTHSEGLSINNMIKQKISSILLYIKRFIYACILVDQVRAGVSTFDSSVEVKASTTGGSRLRNYRWTMDIVD